MEDKLSSADKDILRSVSQGNTLYEVAEERGTSYHTISTQLTLMRLKMGCKNTLHLVAECIRNKIIK